MNVAVDALAKNSIPIAKVSKRHYRVPGEPCSLRYGGCKISDITEEVCDIIHSEEGRIYWANKGKVPKDTVHFIYWEAKGCALKEMPR